MSEEIKRYGHIGYMVSATPYMAQLYPEMKSYVLSSDYDAKCHTADVYFGSWKRTEEDRDDALSQLAALREELSKITARYDHAKFQRGSLRERLADAERRNAELAELLRDASGAVKGHAMTAWAVPLYIKISATLNKSEEAKS